MGTRTGRQILSTRTRSRPLIGVDEPGTRDAASTRVPGYYDGDREIKQTYLSQYVLPHHRDNQVM